MQDNSDRSMVEAGYKAGTHVETTRHAALYPQTCVLRSTVAKAVLGRKFRHLGRYGRCTAYCRGSAPRGLLTVCDNRDKEARMTINFPLFSRAQLVDLLRIDDNLLGYWLKQDIIRRYDEPGGQTRRRLFAPDGIMLTAVCVQLHKCGVKAAMLKRLVDRLYPTIELGRLHLESYVAFPYAKYLNLVDDIPPRRSLPADCAPETLSLARELKVDEFESIQLSEYHELTDPGYVRGNVEPVIWYFSDLGDEFYLESLTNKRPTLLDEGVVNTSIALCVNGIAQDLWRPYATKVGCLPFDIYAPPSKFDAA